MNKYSFLFLISLFAFASLFSVPPHPKKTSGILSVVSAPSKNFGPQSASKRTLPQNVLVMMCQFSDTQFNQDVQYPDFHPHNKEYFNKYMTHLKDFLNDASHGAYKLNYTIHPEFVTLSKPMSYYGDDSIDGERRAEMLSDVISMLDPQIDFSNYDAFILFHAGGGQESDIFDSQPQSIWSSFLTKYDLKDALAPNSSDYQGISTQDNRYISECIIIPEAQRHPDFPTSDSVYDDEYVYDIFGVLAHQFAHQLGLPTLFDNYSQNGSSAGIGNFGLMGTAVWNNNGKTPCLPSAWSRYYMGWEEPVILSSDAENITITYPQNKKNGTPKLYKIPISDNEYFLIENRQTNFRKDAVDIGGQIFTELFTFDVLPDSIQDFYPGTAVPMPNMMENTFLGCEWDYFFPFTNSETGDYVNPSGLYIWHVDENVINQFFTDAFYINRPNNNAFHKGVDLEEADGIQHMDSGLPDYYMRGGPFDSFREGNNNYFGLSVNPINQLFSSPTSESYYGLSNIEIFNISAAADTMTFSVRFNHQINFPNAHSIDAEYIFVDDLNDNGDQELYFINEFDNILFDENGNQNSYTYDENTLTRFHRDYTFDAVNKKLYIPFRSGDHTIMSFDGSQLNLIGQADTETDYSFWAPLISIPDTVSFQGKRAFLAGLSQRVMKVGGSRVNVWLKDDAHQITTYDITMDDYRPLSNMSYNDHQISFLVRKNDKNYLSTINLSDMNQVFTEIGDNQEFNYAYLLQADFDNDDVSEYSLTYKTDQGTFIAIMIESNGNIMPGFPVEQGANSICAPAIADLDHNGTLDLIVGTENGFQAFAYNGAVLNPHFYIADADSSGTAQGLVTIQKNKQTYILALIGHNRLCLWDNTGTLLPGYPVTFKDAYKSPFIYADNDSVFAYLGSRNGSVYKHYLPMFTPQDVETSTFTHTYGNLNRTASWNAEVPGNSYQTTKLFVKNENYVYPNPWLNIYNNKINIRVMLSKTTEAKVSVYDISGNLIWEKRDLCTAYIPNVTSFVMNTDKLSTGMYYAIINANNQSHRLKFAVEK